MRPKKQRPRTRGARTSGVTSRSAVVWAMVHCTQPSPRAVRVPDADDSNMTAKAGKIFIGIGGWTFEPWRGGAFYPKGLPHAKELSYAGERLTSIEINGTFYRTQTPATFRKW